MAIKIYKPTSPGRRDASTLANEEITKGYPEKILYFTRGKAPAETTLVKLRYATRAAALNSYCALLISNATSRDSR